MLPILVNSNDDAVVSFLVERGYIPVPDDVRAGIAVPALGKWAAGYAYRSLERLLFEDHYESRDDLVLERLSALAEAGTPLKAAVAAGLDSIARERSFKFSFAWRGVPGRGRRAKQLKEVIYGWDALVSKGLAL